MSGRTSKGLTRGRWTLICAVVFLLGLAFPPMHQKGELSVNGRITVVDHDAWPAWIGMADEKADIGYTRNGQMEPIYWEITRSINHSAWTGCLVLIGLVWFAGLFRRTRKVKTAVSHYPHVIQPRPPAATQPTSGHAADRAVQPPPRHGSPVYPGIPSGISWRPADPAPPRNAPPPGGRYR